MARGNPPTDQTPPATEPQEPPAADETPQKEPIGLVYKGDGDLHFGGVPKRDLTVRETTDLEPAVLNNITAKGPTGEPLYVLTKAGKEALGGTD